VAGRAQWGHTKLHTCCRLLVGESYMSVDEDFCTEYLEKQQEVVQEKVDNLKSEKKKILDRQSVRGS
jgi:hypothetical protein